MFLDCFKHDRDLCHECLHVGMCDGQPADDCDVLDMTAYKTAVNEKLTNLDNQFELINESLKGMIQSLNFKFLSENLSARDR